ncbi:MAG: cytochrome D ubiquinol oxidase subunit I [Bdellovibrionales bacterium GWC1_52_8]|nr:MAG: cytochrome D ubiquinol oxidase subunit I [Bdellovibrionales bacterium GWB1_52_6]OFZ02846.1 MAG: cytochrome D ubiquinol oxidase subunit I [Bdellovibrionales bacterium GWA1_52_35]OFZ33483.1 MAG: cytochrome D ubiquinol oxidase subunit I [Bdellovibrionales bacterium GWC1_52_8]HCM38428.1 cytochrome ubiquinol oxidase subunit I [Bdellovibrionales bacterium]
MDVLTLSRIQFAVATMFHFLFVPLTIGLALIVAIMETYWVRTGNEIYKKMAKFWGKLFLINFAIGIVTGLTLEFQFGTNWSRYSTYVGDIFGSLLAIEATVAFFLESTFIAVWFFGWNKISKKLHCVSIWIVALASIMSAYWIIAANAWMQHPVGYELRNGRAELVDFLAVVTQRFAVYEFVHVLGGCFMVGGFFVMGISAWHLLKEQNTDFFGRSFKIASIFSTVAAFLVIGLGHMNASILYDTQPAKLAAMEAHWETGKSVPMYLLTWPDEKNSTNYFQTLKVPGMLSLLATNNITAELKGLKEWAPEDRPPVLVSFLTFRLMVGLGMVMMGISLFAVVMRERIREFPWFLKICVYAIPLPYLANELGWVLAEMGRQPWIVYGLMKTRDAVSIIPSSYVLVTLIGFIFVYGLLGAVDFYLLFKIARRGPDFTGGLKLEKKTNTATGGSHA